MTIKALTRSVLPTLTVAGVSLVISCAGAAAQAPRAGAASADATAASPTVTLVHLDFDDLTPGADASDALNSGVVPVLTEVKTVAGGDIEVGVDPSGGSDLKFPDTSIDPLQRAILTVRSADPADGSLSPGRQDFWFGARFNLDAASESTELDNGNNLVQRGLVGDAAQYKVQVDHGKVSCRIAGDAGTVLVQSQITVEAGQWYRAKCTRTADSVVLSVTDRSSGSVDRVTVAGSTGDVVAPASTPLVVGGKANFDGSAVAGNSDQFNGFVDDVFLRTRE